MSNLITCEFMLRKPALKSTFTMYYCRVYFKKKRVKILSNVIKPDNYFLENCKNCSADRPIKFVLIVKMRIKGENLQVFYDSPQTQSYHKRL